MLKRCCRRSQEILEQPTISEPKCCVDLKASLPQEQCGMYLSSTGAEGSGGQDPLGSLYHLTARPLRSAAGEGQHKTLPHGAAVDVTTGGDFAGGGAATSFATPSFSSIHSSSNPFLTVEPARQCDSSSSSTVPLQMRRPIEEIVLESAESQDLHWSVRVGSGDKSLVELLAEAFAMLGISNGQDLLEQIQSDRGHSWLGTRDVLMCNLRTYLRDVCIRPEDARPLLFAASRLLSRCLRRFVLQAQSAGLQLASDEPQAGAAPLAQRGGLAGPVTRPNLCGTAVAGCYEAALELGDLVIGQQQEDKQLERALKIVEGTSAELSRISAAASRAPRREAQALFAQRRRLEESEHYVRALAYIEEHMGAGQGSWCCTGGDRLPCGLPADGGMPPALEAKDCQQRAMHDDQLLLRL